MKKILVVEDEQGLRALLEGWLKATLSNEVLSNEVEMIFASSFREAQEILQNHKNEFNVALMDFDLGDGQGNNLPVRLYNDNCRIFYWSGDQHLTESDMVAFFSKPPHFKILMAAIKAAMED